MPTSPPNSSVTRVVPGGEGKTGQATITVH